MMKTVVVVILCLVAVSAFDEAEQCTPEVCLSEDGCYCASSTSPIGTANTPQVLDLNLYFCLSVLMFVDDDKNY